MSPAHGPAAPNSSIDRWRWWIAPVVFAALTLLCFADLLIGPGGTIVSADDADLAMHFAATRAFGFGELAQGNLPLWNPRMFSGYPYLGGFQPALLYPLNWPFCFLPQGFAINFNVALHVFLAGYFVFLWLRRDCGDLAAATAGAGFMFCGRFFLHIYAGHLPHVCVIPWLAVLLLAIDGICRDARLKWAIFGSVAASMMLLAGAPQMLYFAMVVLPVYAGWRWIQSPVKLRAAGGFGLIAALSIGLCTAQWWTGINAAEESIRRGGVDYEFAASFSFPPENLLTAIAPDALGRARESVGTSAVAPYFGQAYPWEMSVYVGATALLLAMVGVGSSPAAAALPLAIILISVTLGLGANTPVHRVLHEWLPGFSSFRGSSKFLYIASLFLLQLTAMGLASIMRRPRRRWPVALGAGLAVSVVCFGYAVQRSASAGVDGAFASALRSIADRSEARHDWYYPRQNFEEPIALRLMGRTSAASFYAAGLWMAASAVLLVLAWRRSTVAVLGIAVLVAVESLGFARTNRPTTDLVPELPSEWVEALQSVADDGTRFVRNPSAYDYRGPKLSRALDAWGYDPGTLARYARLLEASQRLPPETAKWGLFFQRDSEAIFRLTRIAAVLTPVGPASQPMVFVPVGHPLPSALIVPNASVFTGDEATETIVQILATGRLDPASTVLLESPPSIAPATSPDRPNVDFSLVDTDTRRIRVALDEPGILLITESYSRHWRARPVQPAPPEQDQYQIMPANAAFIAVPLARGSHDLELVYAPPGWIVGRWISLASLAVLVGLAMAAGRRGAGQRP